MVNDTDFKPHIADAEVAYTENIMSTTGKGYALQEPHVRQTRTAVERKLLRKTDCLLVPLLALIYFAAYLDRNSFGNGKLLGLTKELHMTADQYSICAYMFFIGYLIFMLPGNILLRFIRPWQLIGAAVIIFGSLLCGMSAAKNFQTVLALRVLIGASQAFVQGTGMYTTLWYKRTEVATRGALYYSAATLSGAFSGLISYAVGHNLTAAKTGRSPWKWLFLIEGIIAIFVGILVLILLPDFPDQMKKGKNWLFTEEEISLAIERSTTFNTTHSRLDWSQVLAALKDPKAWAYSFINAGVGMALSTLGVFLPTFIQDFGYTNLDAQLFSVIPYACAFVILPLTAMLSDRLNTKGPFIVSAVSIGCIGYAILLTPVSTGVKMFAVCLIVPGMYTGIVLTVTWLGINTGGFSKRAATWALAEIFSQVFAIVGTKLYKGPPRYIEGHALVLGFLIFAVANIVFLWVYMARSNKMKDQILAEYAARNEVHPDAEKTLEEVYDNHINFRYTL